MIIIKILFSIILWLLPWPLRCYMLNKFLRFKISPKAKIGYSIIIPNHLEMLEGSRIGHLTICKGLNLLHLGISSSIGNLNWISGYPLNGHFFFNHRLDRDPSLIIGNHSAITHRHIIDCNDKIIIGDYSTIAGYRSQILTHYINIIDSIQDCKPIKIGSYCFVGTSCVLLPGSSLGDYCVLSALSLLNKEYEDQYKFYGGIPAVKLTDLSKDALYFSRKVGFIN